MSNENTPGLTMMSVIEAKYYWQQRCKKAEQELEHVSDLSRRQGIWIELAWHVLDRGTVGPEEIDYLMRQFTDIASQGGSK